MQGSCKVEKFVRINRGDDLRSEETKFAREQKMKRVRKIAKKIRRIERGQAVVARRGGNKI